MVRPEKFDHLHLVYHFTVPLRHFLLILIAFIFFWSFFQHQKTRQELLNVLSAKWGYLTSLTIPIQMGNHFRCSSMTIFMEKTVTSGDNFDERTTL